ncbi:MAG: UbiA family prenyltransferase [Phycisphaerales bacterium]|nr:UbiA family prenyltransferase [Phycisphaerales bacterium]MDP6890140.1 UbiA family prenyltransferase [Phycisphaerales bacterium]
MPRSPARTSLIEAMGHMAVWAGLYAVGCVLFVFGVLDLPVRWRPLVIAMLVTTGTYLLDRVGGWSAMPDRADLASVPRRVRFLRRRMPRPRSVAVGLLVLGLAFAASEGWLVAVLVPTAVVGMMAYGHLPGAGRLKDRLLLKNAAVAASLTGMAVVLVLAESMPREPLAWFIAAGVLMLHVLAGAMLCDLDDRHSDARHGTRTLPNTLGPACTWWVADGLVVVASGLLLLASDSGWVDSRHAVSLATFPPLVVILLHTLRPRVVRDLVDLGFPLAVTLALLLG